MCFSLFILYTYSCTISKNLNFIKVQYQLKKANQLLDKNIVVDAGYITSLKNDASTSELYYTSLAKNFLLSGRYNRAVEALLVAKDYTSSPSVYLTLASCYAREGKTADAIQCVQIAKGIIPHHFFRKSFCLGCMFSVRTTKRLWNKPTIY